MTAALLEAPANPWALPAGRVVLPSDAPRERWLEYRRRGLGGSDAPTLLGVSRFGTPYRVWLDKTGRAGADVQTEPMRRGTWLEAPIAEHFTTETGIESRRMGLVQSLDLPWLQFTPDRVLADGGVLEVKSAGQWADVRHDWASGAPVDAYVQLQHGLLVTGRSHGWLIGYVIDRAPFIRGPFPRDEELIGRLRERLTTWWASYVLTDTPPPVDVATADDAEVLARWPELAPESTREARYPAAVRKLLAERAELAAVEAAGRKAEKRRREIDTALRVMAEGASALTVEGAPVLLFRDQRSGAPQLDPAFAEDHPELHAVYVRPPATTRRLYLPKPPAAPAAKRKRKR